MVSPVVLAPIQSDWPSVSLIIPVHNGGEEFYYCLHHLRQLTVAPLEIIVVDDGSTDYSADLAERFGALVFRLSTPQGPAVARNYGAKVARGEILLFMNPDVIPSRDIIAQVQTAFHADPTLAALVGSYADRPATANFLSQYKHLFDHYMQQINGLTTPTFLGAGSAMRQEVFWAVGGFDERYRHPSVEDVELGQRLKRSGYGLRRCPALQLYCLTQWQLLSLIWVELIHRSLPGIELLWRDRAYIPTLNLTLTHRFSVLATGLILALLVTSSPFPLLHPLRANVGLIAIMAASIGGVTHFPLYRFFYHRQGFWFLLRAIPCHSIQLFHRIIIFAIGTLCYHILPKRSPYPLRISQV